MASPHRANGGSTTNGTKESFQLLTASYNSPTNAPFAFTKRLPTPATSSTADRVAYLSKLRAATTELQKTINEELTQRMEEDKIRTASGAVEGSKICVVDEGKEEENYGEEVVEDDG